MTQGTRSRDALENHILNQEQRLLEVELEHAGSTTGDDDRAYGDNNEGGHDFRSAVEHTKLDAEMFAPEFIKRQYFEGVPQAELPLTPGMVVVLLRNIDPSRSLMNGVRLVVVRVRRNFVVVRHVGERTEHIIPKIRFDVKIGTDKLHFQRHQVPLRHAYGCTIHKAQAATLDRVVIDLRQGVFDHGQLYVALSRVRNASDIIVLVAVGQENVMNIVHRLILQMGRCI